MNNGSQILSILEWENLVNCDFNNRVAGEHDFVNKSQCWNFPVTMAIGAVLSHRNLGSFVGSGNFFLIIALLAQFCFRINYRLWFSIAFAFSVQCVDCWGLFAWLIWTISQFRTSIAWLVWVRDSFCLINWQWMRCMPELCALVRRAYCYHSPKIYSQQLHE